jgi:hypothetical protein
MPCDFMRSHALSFALFTLMAGGPAHAVEGLTPRLGILQHTPEHLQENRDAGAQVVVISLAWDRAEPAMDQFSASYFEQVRSSIEACRKLGYDIAVDPGLQYPPAWIFQLPHSRFVNQYGRAFTSTKVGENIPNAVFNQAIRDRQENVLRHMLKEIGPELTQLRLGWMKYGELAFPLHTFENEINCYWGFDKIARGRVPGLPPGLEPCPTGDWRPGQPSPQHARARAFLHWYLGALQNYHDWQIATARKYTEAPLAMLYPSWGLRPGHGEAALEHDLDGSTSPEINGELQRGLDLERLVTGIRDTRVIVYCTWLDTSPAFSEDDSPDRSRWSPAHYLSTLAEEHRPPLHAWAENTGGGDSAVLSLCQDRILNYGFRGFVWAFERDLYDGQPPEINDFAEFSRRLRGPISPDH